MSGDTSESRIGRFGNLTIDFRGHQVHKGEIEVKLTALEFALLKYFVDHRGKVLTRSDILENVWEDDVIVDMRTVDTHVANLRRKLEDDPSHPKWIIGVRGVGYKLTEQ